MESMKVKTSISLPADLLASIDRADCHRSALLDQASRAYLAGMGNARRDARDVRIINANAKRLNREAQDVIDYQGLP
jgi:metal-responsive CopG/Arc/MetJ family transcriptional regulator